MADELDAMLEGSDQTPASPAQNEGQGDDLLEGQTPEEVEFNKLSGSTQERIRQLATRARDAEAKLGANTYVPPPAPAFNQPNPDVQNAVQQLSNVGIATDAKVDAKLDERLNVLRWDMEQQRLEQKYSGDDGKSPTYVREEVENYIRSHPQYAGYAAEDVFRDHMFRDEFKNLDLSRVSTRTGRTSTLRPTRSTGADTSGFPQDMDELQKKLEGPGGQQYYNDHFEEINKAAERWTKQFAE